MGKPYSLKMIVRPLNKGIDEFQREESGVHDLIRKTAMTIATNAGGYGADKDVDIRRDTKRRDRYAVLVVGEDARRRVRSVMGGQ